MNVAAMTSAETLHAVQPRTAITVGVDLGNAQVAITRRYARISTTPSNISARLHFGLLTCLLTGQTFSTSSTAALGAPLGQPPDIGSGTMPAPTTSSGSARHRQAMSGRSLSATPAATSS
jgi:hypothetical protein